jgi:hypothetical protein
VVAHRFKLGDGPFFCSFGVESVEVVGAEVVVEAAVGCHVPDRDQRGVLDCDVGLLGSAT